MSVAGGLAPSCLPFGLDWGSWGARDRTPGLGAGRKLSLGLPAFPNVAFMNVGLRPKLFPASWIPFLSPFLSVTGCKRDASAAADCEQRLTAAPLSVPEGSYLLWGGGKQSPAGASNMP